jgi:two-component system OmpR family response regulator
MGQKIVLHIDDDPEMRVIVKLSLELRNDYFVIGFNSITDARAHLQIPDIDPPACVLLDYYVCGTSGIDFVVSCRNEAVPQAPVVFLTTRLTKGFLDHMLAAGALGVIGKPFNPITLSQELTALLGEERH